MSDDEARAWVQVVSNMVKSKLPPGSRYLFLLVDPDGGVASSSRGLDRSTAVDALRSAADGLDDRTTPEYGNPPD